MRMPIFASGIDAGKNIGKAFAMGFSPKFKGSRMSIHAKSIGGALTVGGLGTAGAIGGAALSTQTSKDDTKELAIGGAVLGTAALPVLGASTRGIYEGGKHIGKSISGMEKGAFKEAAKKVGRGLSKGANAATGVISHAPVAGHLGTSIAGLSGMAVDLDKMKNASSVLDSVRLTNPISGFKAGWKAGKGAGKIGHGIAGGLINGESLLFGGAIVSGAAGAIGEISKQKMGSIDGYTTNTPVINQISSTNGRYVDNAGADGNLALAMSKLGRGGY